MLVVLGARIVNAAGATFNLAADVWFATPGGSGDGYFDNAGTFRKTAGAGAAIFGQGQGVTFTNTGSVEVLSGSLQLGSSLTGTVSHTGTFSIAAGATLAVVGGGHTFASGSTISGAGSLQVAGGTAALAGAFSLGTTVNVSSGVLVLNTPTTLAGLAFSGGTIGGSAASTVGTLAWTGGGFANGGGSLTVTGTGAVTGAHAATIVGFTLRNAGVFTWSAADGSSQVRFTLGGRFVNTVTGTFNLTTDAWFVTPGGSGDGYFDNAGTFRKTAGAGAALFGQAQGVTFTNTGTVEIQAGSLQLGSSLTSITHTGAFTVAAGTTLAVVGGGHTFSASSAITGDGAFHVGGGTATVAGTFTSAGALAVSGGALVFNTPAAIAGGVLLSGGTFGGSAASTTPTLTWTGGGFASGGGSLTVSGTGAVTGAHAATIVGFTLRNAGVVTWSAVDSSGQVRFTLGGRFVNTVTGTFNLTTDAWFVTPGGSGDGYFDNAGTFRKTTGAGAALFGQAQGVTFTNTGTVEIQSGSF